MAADSGRARGADADSGAQACSADPEQETQLLRARLDATERALRISEERYRRLVLATTDYVYTARISGGQVAGTQHGPACAAVTGYSQEDFATDPFLWLRMVVLEDRPLVEEQARRILAGEPVEAIEHRITHRDGRVRWVRNTPVPHRDSSGSLVSYDGLIQDISERREAERALQESEERYRQLFDAAGDAVFVHELGPGGRPGRFLEANDVACRRLGYSREELLALSPPQINAPWEDSEIAPVLERYAAGEPATFEQVHLTREGRRIPVEIHGRPFTFKGRPAVIALVRDITERKRAEQELRQREQRFRAIVETTQEWIWAIDTMGRHTYSNRGVERILGYTPEELVGQSAGARFDPEERARIGDLLRAKSAAREGWTGLVVRWRHKDGSVRYLESNAVPILDGQGELIGYQGSDRDITERKRAEEEKERLQSELTQAQKMEAIGRLAGGVAHDFNNLLTALLGYADLTLLELDPSSHAAHNQRGILEVVEQAKALTQQILAFSRRQVLQMTNVDLNAELLSAGKMLRRLIGEEIEIVTSLEPDLELVRGDRSQLQQVLVNLALNARDAMPHGGRLTITTANAGLPADISQLALDARSSAYVQLTVGDTGLGMDADTLSRVFEPFFTTKELGRGTGLGLATVYGIVRQHGGFIDVASAPGEGALFKVHLPRAEAPTQVEAPATSPPSAERGSEAILVVEDDAMVRELTCQQLSDCGYRVLSAAGPQAALDLALQHAGPIEMVLTDVVMPGMNAREMYARLSAQRPGLRVLFMSGYPGDTLAQDGGVLDAGLRLIHKPFGIAALTRKIREVLGEAQGTSER